MNALASVRVTVEMYIPPKTRGRLDTTLLEKYETSISDIVNAEVEKAGEKYDISTDGILSTDDIYNESDNLFFMYIKSFMVLIKVKINPTDGASGLDGENNYGRPEHKLLRSSSSMKRQVFHKDMNASFIININNNLKLDEIH